MALYKQRSDAAAPFTAGRLILKDQKSACWTIEALYDAGTILRIGPLKQTLNNASSLDRQTPPVAIFDRELIQRTQASIVAGVQSPSSRY